ncbi:RagB/SusD family nutrient uptake outer membrane protein [Mucilaginibacter sp. BJC16-A38]|uniref:RagB/SusD family nutrient uptake outer membrane protein n=1 Tax=Mucilaginibacter phenanthrenivorans TaxID=1234842 RepID=UPI0021573BFD|nr:RagB/SusD family nutrient uptake outer membrane protein [Mucilaginibacter phenanthrenivorans]MCR8556722.1 RagB/SusD family nutrient uptake outer membrane protein [Mucilaginibacter phenanthrenivorans]
MKIKIFAIVLLVSLAGCKKSFLEIPSKTALSTTVYFKSESDFQQAINGAYAPLRGAYNGSSGAWAMGELRSDNTTYVYNPNDRGNVQGEYVCDFLDDNTSGTTPNKYYSDYQLIARVNQILALIDGVPFDASDKNNIKGQAYFLRAFCYFDLVQYFGSVPLHLKPVSTLAETALPLSSADVIYKQIIADAQQANTLLPGKATQEPGRVTSGSAKTLLGNVYIVLKQWADAETILKTITGYSLLPNYADIYNVSNKNNAESIFEIQYKEGTEGFASSFFYTFLVEPVTAGEVTAVTGIPENGHTGEGYNIPTPDIIGAYEPNDTRKNASIAYITASGVSYPFINKYNHPHALSGNTNDNWPVYRYAEVLLFLAEALNEENKPSEAIPYLNQVRARAGLPATAAASQTDVRNAIIKERRVELAFENKRWLDLVHFGLADQVMKAYGAKVKANPQAYYFPVGFSPAPTAYTNIRILFPIPASEVALNPYF